IFIAARPCRLRHLLNGGRSVAPCRVDVEVATDVRERDEFRQGASVRERDFAAVLAQLWRDKGKAELLVDLLLALAGQQSFLFEETVLVQLPSAIIGEL